MNNVIQLFTKGEVKSGEREFTRLIGGFGNDSPVISDIQIAELLKHKNGARHVRELISKNIRYFETDTHILDVKKGVDQTDTLKETLVSLGYSKQSLTQSKNIYILSKAGFLLYLKFAEGDKAVEFYKDFLEDYFQTKAENTHMKLGIKDQIKQLKEKQAMKIGMSILENDVNKKVELMNEFNDLSNQVVELEKLLSKEEVIKSLQPKLHVGELIENAKNDYDIGTFAKFINVENMGRNKLFQWLRDKEILMSNNIPYQRYNKYFNVIPVTKGNYTNHKPLLKPKGIEFIVKKLIDDGKVVTKSVDEILNELPKAN